jgi:hypothetical protein
LTYVSAVAAGGPADPPQNAADYTPTHEGMLAYVKRTTVKIPDALDARLRHEAARRGMTIADISREALEAYLGTSPSNRRHLGAAGAGRSGHSDVSERIEEILATEVLR